MHEKAKRLSLLDNILEGGTRWLENEVKQLEKENYKLKIDVKSLEMIYNSYCSGEANLKVTFF